MQASEVSLNRTLKTMLIDSDVLVWMTRGHGGAVQRLAQVLPWRLSAVTYIADSGLRPDTSAMRQPTSNDQFPPLQAAR